MQFQLFSATAILMAISSPLVSAYSCGAKGPSTCCVGLYGTACIDGTTPVFEEGGVNFICGAGYQGYCCNDAQTECLDASE